MGYISKWVSAVTILALAVSAVAAEPLDAAGVAEIIDHHIGARLESEGVAPAVPADDGEFLRRVYLDLHGVVPSAAAAARFIDDTNSDKRRRLIDDLLADPRFGEHFGDVWQRRLLSPLLNVQRTHPERFAAWLAQRFNEDRWDRTVYDLLTAAGTMDDNPAVTWLIEGRHPLSVTDLTDLTSRYFLGVRLNCAQCHDHPFVTDWSQDDYWGMAAFFAQIQTPDRPKMVYMKGVQDDARMTLSTLKNADVFDGFRAAAPTFPGGKRPELIDKQTYRQTLAQWITSPDNPYFARATVNRMWWRFFGRGLVNPVDDMHTGNAPSHPRLLAALSQRFVESGFDLKDLCRAILNSRAYQRTSRAADRGDREAELFARMSVKVLSPEQLYDSLVAVVGPPAKAPEVNTRLGARHEFTQFFAADGEPDPTRYERGIVHALRLMNSRQFAGRSIDALVRRVGETGRSQEKAADELFLTILSRRPTDAERQMVRDHLRGAGRSSHDAWRELAWALLMSSEFSLNH